MPYDTALLELVRRGGEICPHTAPDDVRRWWLESALLDYGRHALLPAEDLPQFRDITWQMVDRAAKLAAGAERVAKRRGGIDLLDTVAVVGSVGRGEATDESDVDWNAVLSRSEVAPGEAPEPPGTDDDARAYCAALSARDRAVGIAIDFPQWSRELQQERCGYRRTGRERLRAFTAAELCDPYPQPARTGLAATALVAGLSVPHHPDGPRRWERFRRAVALCADPRSAALGAACLAGLKIARLAPVRHSAQKVGRHAAHGAMVSLCTLVLAAQDPPVLDPVPYWRAPLLVSGFTTPVRQLLAILAFLVAHCRVRKTPPGDAVMETLAQLVDLVQVEIADVTAGRFSASDVAAVVGALRQDGRHPGCRAFCS